MMEKLEKGRTIFNEYAVELNFSPPMDYDKEYFLFHFNIRQSLFPHVLTIKIKFPHNLMK